MDTRRNDRVIDASLRTYSSPLKVPTEFFANTWTSILLHTPQRALESATTKLSAAELAKILQPLMDWEILSRNEKRLLLEGSYLKITIKTTG
jgi:hypothetical protein